MKNVSNERLLSLVTGTLSAGVILYISLAGVFNWPYAEEVQKVGGIVAIFVNSMFAVWTGVKVGGEHGRDPSD
ncbi:hypothetical protein [Candidatus Enterococcus clewellii]|uniref:Uncharacterized protein n=1 Tax=Candidatus Enterococcus clewellii TaxID=1834193 RepID=A0A242K8U1_9ENTE|nr:hypothetical protein [Enterococcus sp. 9E7_DIV0242]OTP17583.1 hypothetical protein A5888_001721 [Enterococcus sp. 9E7_DIV0242]